MGKPMDVQEVLPRTRSVYISYRRFDTHCTLKCVIKMNSVCKTVKEISQMQKWCTILTHSNISVFKTSLSDKILYIHRSKAQRYHLLGSKTYQSWRRHGMDAIFTLPFLAANRSIDSTKGQYATLTICCLNKPKQSDFHMICPSLNEMV